MSRVVVDSAQQDRYEASYAPARSLSDVAVDSAQQDRCGAAYAPTCPMCHVAVNSAQRDRYVAANTLALLPMSHLEVDSA